MSKPWSVGVQDLCTGRHGEVEHGVFDGGVGLDQVECQRTSLPNASIMMTSSTR